jgi:hypothetical protein
MSVRRAIVPAVLALAWWVQLSADEPPVGGAGAATGPAAATDTAAATAAAATDAATATGPATAGSAPQPPSHRLVQNTDVVRMAESHLDESTMLSVIELNDCNFDVSPEGLVALKNAGVSDRVLNAMLEAVRRKQSVSTAATPAAPAAASTPAGVTGPGPIAPAGFPGMPAMDPQMAATMQAALARARSMGYAGSGGLPPVGGLPSTGYGGPPPVGGMPRVFLLANGARTELAAASAQRAMSQFKGGGGPNQGAMMLTSLATQALHFATFTAGPAAMAAGPALSMVSHFLPGMHSSTPSITFAWGLPGTRSERVMSDAAPAFECEYKDIPGVDPDAFEPVLVRLVLTRDNYRLIGATRQQVGRGMGMSAGESEWIAEDRVRARVQKKERGSYRLQAEKPLQPGEYGLVLRPVKGYKAQSSGFGGSEQLAAAVWDFSLPSAFVDATQAKKK